MTNDSELLDADRLQKWYGTTRDADVLRYLKRDRVPFTTGIKGRPCTTLALLESAIRGDKDAADGFDFRATA